MYTQKVFPSHRLPATCCGTEIKQPASQSRNASCTDHPIPSIPFHEAEFVARCSHRPRHKKASSKQKQSNQLRLPYIILRTDIHHTGAPRTRSTCQSWGPACTPYGPTLCCVQRQKSEKKKKNSRHDGTATGMTSCGGCLLFLWRNLE